LKSSAKKIELASVDDLFSTEESRQDEQLEKIQEIPLSELHPFKDHPFKVKDDDAMILNDLAASFEGRNEYISRLCSYPLLILDDFGMERGTEYGLEQVYSVIDSRYRSGKPLIATTNLTLEELQHPQDTPHARIYDRLTSMCAPVRFTGSNFRKETAQEKLERLKQLMKQRKESL